ncbi:MAG: HAD family hydrolase [Balneola sp.]|nr:MAG: HAD family hydrolase [Balneola sp.]
MTQLSIKQYDLILFDHDGVVLDSNWIKYDNIKKVTAPYIQNSQEQGEFLDYFIGNSGVPREEKLLKYFKESDFEDIMRAYNELNLQTLKGAGIVPGLENLLTFIQDKNVPMRIVSGGDEAEVKEVMDHKKLSTYFTHIHGGPKSKKYHLLKMNLPKNVLFFGDSKKDYEVATEFGLDFIFIYGFTAMSDWGNFFCSMNDVLLIKDYTDLQIN